jgi:hypothetical protein
VVSEKGYSDVKLPEFTSSAVRTGEPNVKKESLPSDLPTSPALRALTELSSLPKLIDFLYENVKLASGWSMVFCARYLLNKGRLPLGGGFKLRLATADRVYEGL